MPRHKSRKRARRSRRKRGGGCGDITIEDKMRAGAVFKAANEFAKQYEAESVTDLDSFIKVGKYFTEGQGDYSFTPKLNAFHKKARDTEFGSKCGKPFECKLPGPWDAFLPNVKVNCTGNRDDLLAGDGCCSYTVGAGGRRRKSRKNRRKSRRKSKKRRRKTKKRRRRRRR